MYAGHTQASMALKILGGHFMQAMWRKSQRRERPGVVVVQPFVRTHLPHFVRQGAELIVSKQRTGSTYATN